MVTESEAHKAQNSHLLAQVQSFCSITLMSVVRWEKRETKTSSPRFQRSWLSPHPNSTLEPSEFSCLVQLREDGDTLTASSLYLLCLPLPSLTFKVPVSGIPWTQRREGGSHKNWAAVPSGECRPCFSYHGPPSDPYCSEPTTPTLLASVEIVEAFVTHPSSYRHLASASSSCLAGEHQRPLHNNVGTTEPFT